MSRCVSRSTASPDSGLNDDSVTRLLTGRVGSSYKQHHALTAHEYGHVDDGFVLGTCVTCVIQWPNLEGNKSGHTNRLLPGRRVRAGKTCSSHVLANQGASSGLISAMAKVPPLRRRAGAESRRCNPGVGLQATLGL